MAEIRCLEHTVETILKGRVTEMAPDYISSKSQSPMYFMYLVNMGKTAFPALPVVMWLAWLDFMQTVQLRSSCQNYPSDPINKLICSLLLQNQRKIYLKNPTSTIFIIFSYFISYFHKTFILNIRNLTPYFYF